MLVRCGMMRTAVVITGPAVRWPNGVAEAGAAAGKLIEGLLAAAPAFGYRMPELHGGHRAEAGRRPIPYPASCRPQAWSAASAIAIVTALLGPRPDAPAGTLEFRPLLPAPESEPNTRVTAAGRARGDRAAVRRPVAGGTGVGRRFGRQLHSADRAQRAGPDGPAPTDPRRPTRADRPECSVQAVPQRRADLVQR